MFYKGLFILAHQCGDTSFYSVYKKLVKNQWRPYDELKRDQEKQLRHLIEFSYDNVPYYRNLFKCLGLFPRDIQIVEDLEKLPILTKDIIKEHWNEFKPVNLSSIKHYNWATGGSTGTPMQYRISKKDRFLGGAMLYRGWEHGGFELGDKMVNLGAGVRVYDPFVPAITTKAGVFASAGSVEEALAGAECAVFLVDHDLFRGISMEMVKELMAAPVVVDGKNLFEGGEGVVYVGIGKEVS